MRRIFFTVTLLCLAMQLQAAEWMTDLPKALAQAKAEKKAVLLDFTGSDWCPDCRELRKKVFSTPAFDDYAKANLVLVMVDFPEKLVQSDSLKQANKALSDKYEVKGYPTIIVLDSDGKKLLRDDDASAKSAKEFFAEIEKVLSK